MKREWIQYLCDPFDGSELSFQEISLESGDRVIAGKLASRSGSIYEIREGIPIFVTEQVQSPSSVQSFAYEWNEFGFMYAKTGWVSDVVNELVGGVEFFQGKIVVDAGAGSGAQSRWMAEAGARLVLSLELSDAIFVRHRETIAGYEDSIFPIQCDLAHPPLRVAPDVVYCLNVLPFTKNTRQAFARLADLLGEGSVFVFNLYTKSSTFKERMVRMVRGIIRVLPFWLWKWIACAVTCIAYPLSKLSILRKPAQAIMPISHSFRETWLDLYDAYGAHHYQQYISRPEQMAMIRELGLNLLREATFGYVVSKQSPVLQGSPPGAAIVAA